MSGATNEDRFDALERRHQERHRAAEDLAGMLGLRERTSPATGTEGAGDVPRDEGGRFVGPVDAGEKGKPVVPKPSMGHMIMALIEDDDSYLDGT